MRPVNQFADQFPALKTGFFSRTKFTVVIPLSNVKDQLCQFYRFFLNYQVAQSSYSSYLLCFYEFVEFHAIPVDPGKTREPIAQRRRRAFFRIAKTARPSRVDRIASRDFKPLPQPPKSGGSSPKSSRLEEIFADFQKKGKKSTPRSRLYVLKEKILSSQPEAPARGDQPTNLFFWKSQIFITLAFAAG